MEGMLGEIRYSILTLDQFQKLYGKGWILMDGSSIIGSDLEKTFNWNAVPDARGLFLRAKNNGRSDGQENPSGDLKLGQLQEDTLKSHNHIGLFVNNIIGQWGQTAYQGEFDSHRLPTQPYGSTREFYTGHTGDKETCPKSITVNVFIKINWTMEERNTFSRDLTLDVHETEKELIVNAELPGVTKEQVNVDIHDSTLIISGEIKQDEKYKGRNSRIQERCYGTFHRSLLLPSNVRIDDITAKLEHGILEVKILKVDPTIKKNIPVQ